MAPGTLDPVEGLENASAVKVDPDFESDPSEIFDLPVSGTAVVSS